MVYYSTDYVFNGQKKAAYIESDQTAPETVYGKSKLAGEEAVMASLDDYIIFRIAWLYGLQGKNFVKTMMRLGKRFMDSMEKGEKPKALKVVDDQFGNPTWTEEIVKQTDIAIQNNLNGLFHCTSEGKTSWYQFACDIFEILSWNVDLKPCTTDEYPRPAPRPHNSSLENHGLKEIGMNTMRDYETALREFIKKHRKELMNEL